MSKMTAGLRRMCAASRMISSVTPTSSAATPKLLIRAIVLTPTMLMTVVNTTRPAASSKRVLGAVRRRHQADVRRAADDLEPRPDLRRDDLVGDRHRGQRDDRAHAQDPAAEKGGERPGDLLGPLVDRAGQRVLPGELGEAQRDQELAGEHGGPGPDERRAARDEAEEEQLEHAGHDRDVAEPRGERGEQPERPVQLLLVTELGQFVGVRTRHGHGSFSLRRMTSL